MKEDKNDKPEKFEEKQEEKKSEGKSDDKSEDKPEEKSDSEEEKSEESDESEEKDSHIIIADINEIKDGDDVPKTDEYIDSSEVKDGNFRKTSKSLSVEVEK